MFPTIPTNADVEAVRASALFGALEAYSDTFIAAIPAHLGALTSPDGKLSIAGAAWEKH